MGGPDEMSQDPLPGPGSHGPGSHGPGSHGPGSHGPGSHGPGSHGPGSHGPGAWWGRLRGARRARLVTIGAGVAAVIVALSVVGATIGSGRPASHRLSQARNFTLSTLGHPGRHISLASFAGRSVIVNFFASWCEPCKRETPLIARYYRTTHGHPAVIGIDVNDPAAAAEAFIHKSGVAYPVAVDPLPMNTAIAYRLPGLPATFFLNARHQIVKRVFGALTPAALATGSKLMTGRGG